MGLTGCNSGSCNCGIESESLEIVRVGDIFQIEQTDFSNLAALEAAVANLQAGAALVPGLYVAKAGDTMSGALTIAAGGGQLLTLRNSTGDSYVYFREADDTAAGYVGTFTTEKLMRVWSYTGYGIRFGTNNLERMRIDSTNGIVLVGKTATNVASTGVELNPGGPVSSTRAVNGTNYVSNKTGAADANGTYHFGVYSAGALIGSITRATASTVAFNTSSDEALKTNIVEIDDELAEYWARLVQPLFFEFIRSPGDVHAGYIAQRVAALWPESITLGIITPGIGTADDRTFDHEGNETTPDGAYSPWMMDMGKMVPFIHAAWQATDRKMTTLMERVDRLELALEGAALAIAKLQKP